MARRETPEINAGSMADIAFLLLIFFLVTTTMDVDGGIARTLPPIIENEDTPPPIKKKNIFTIKVNANDQLLANGDLILIKDLRKEVKSFIDNNGDGTSDYCKGEKKSTSSDNPNKAVVSLQNDRGTSYGMYVKVQNEIMAAYNELREELSMKKYGKSFAELKDKESIKDIKDSYPMKISEADPVDVNM